MGFDTSIPLGKATDYQFEYNPALLFPIARSMGRDVIGIEASNLPFQGFDRWTAFELSWLNQQGRPEQAIAEFVIGTEDIGSVDPRYRDMAQRAKSEGMQYLKSDEGGNFLEERYFDQDSGEEVSEEVLMNMKTKGKSFRPLSNTPGEGRYVYEIR